MNCADAQKVWGHRDGFFAGLDATYPQVLPRLERLVSGLANKGTNPSFEGIKRKVGPLSSTYYVEHAEDTDPVADQIHDVVGDMAARLTLQKYFSEKLNLPVTLFNLCCKGCGASLDELSLDESVMLQNAAIRTDIDGSDIVL